MIVPVHIDNHCVGGGMLTKEPKILRTAAFVQISILTVLFHQKRS